MIFVFVEDGTLDVIGDVAEAQRNYEGIDVESDAFIFYDEDGNYLKPHFIVPNKTGRLLGLFPWVKSGIFELVPTKNTDSFREDPIWLKLYESQQINPNPWFKTLDEVKQYLRDKGVKVERD